MTSTNTPYPTLFEVPNGYCPIHATGVKLPGGFAGIALQYAD